VSKNEKKTATTQICKQMEKKKLHEIKQSSRE
jgi:hypothetical protein